MNRGLVVIICLLFFSLSILPTKAITRLTKASVDYPVHNLNTKFNYATIQEAINAPETQDRNTISVEAGTYYENVVINKSLSLMGENRETSTIDGARKGVTVSMEADNSSISGFRIQNSGSSDYDCGLSIFSSGNSLSNNSVTANRNGILINPGSDANILASNSVSANELYGIHLWYSDNDILNGNTVANCFDGVIIEFCRNLILRNNVMSANLYNFGLGGWELPYFIHDIDKSNKVDGKTVQYMINEENIVIDPTFDVGCLYLVNSTKVTIKDLTLNTPCWNGIQFAYTENSRIENVTVSETSYAIDFAHSFNNIVTSSSIMNRNGIRLFNSDNNTIVSNRISRNDQAILLFNSSDNTIVGNSIDNCWRGLFLSSLNNRIFHNNFINNSVQVFTDNFARANIWDNGYPSGGNYWSYYNGTDLFTGPYQNVTGSDGIGDSRYGVNANPQTFPEAVQYDNYPLMQTWKLGDVDYDGSVTCSDLTMTAGFLGDKPESPHWNPRADLRQDNVINVLD